MNNLRRTWDPIFVGHWSETKGIDTNMGDMICVGEGDDVDLELFALDATQCPTHMKLSQDNAPANTSHLRRT